MRRRRPLFWAFALGEGIDAMLSGDVDAGKAIRRDTINATVGFEKLGEAADTPPKSLIRMFGPRGNPQARNLFGSIRLPAKAGGRRVSCDPEASLKDASPRLGKAPETPYALKNTSTPALTVASIFAGSGSRPR